MRRRFVVAALMALVMSLLAPGPARADEAMFSELQGTVAFAPGMRCTGLGPPMATAWTLLAAGESIYGSTAENPMVVQGPARLEAVGTVAAGFANLSSGAGSGSLWVGPKLYPLPALTWTQVGTTVTLSGPTTANGFSGTLTATFTAVPVSGNCVTSPLTLETILGTASAVLS